jgi:hypothetical protein
VHAIKEKPKILEKEREREKENKNTIKSQHHINQQISESVYNNNLPYGRRYVNRNVIFFDLGECRAILFIGEILMNGGKNVILGMVGCPIENRFTGVGSPEAVARHGRPLNNRQRRLLNKLPWYDSRVTVKKSDVSMIDLAALTAQENVEFAMFTRGPERLIVRGDRYHVNINPFDAAVLNARGYKWSGHTHIGGWLMESEGDMIILRQIGRAHV